MTAEGHPLINRAARLNPGPLPLEGLLAQPDLYSLLEAHLDRESSRDAIDQADAILRNFSAWIQKRASRIVVGSNNAHFTPEEEAAVASRLFFLDASDGVVNATSRRSLACQFDGWRDKAKGSRILDRKRQWSIWRNYLECLATYLASDDYLANGGQSRPRQEQPRLEFGALQPPPAWSDSRLLSEPIPSDASIYPLPEDLMDGVANLVRELSEFASTVIAFDWAFERLESARLASSPNLAEMSWNGSLYRDWSQDAFLHLVKIARRLQSLTEDRLGRRLVELYGLQVWISELVREETGFLIERAQRIRESSILMSDDQLEDALYDDVLRPFDTWLFLLTGLTSDNRDTSSGDRWATARFRANLIDCCRELICRLRDYVPEKYDVAGFVGLQSERDRSLYLVNEYVAPPFSQAEPRPAAIGYPANALSRWLFEIWVYGRAWPLSRELLIESLERVRTQRPWAPPIDLKLLDRTLDARPSRHVMVRLNKRWPVFSGYPPLDR